MQSIERGVIGVLTGVLLLWSGLGAAEITPQANVEDLTSMATNQALATWKPVEVANGSYVVTRKPISKTVIPGCASSTTSFGTEGRIVRDHTLKVCAGEQ
jgi:hypothetical protein